MSTVQRVAQIFGIVFILVGILGFVATGLDMTADTENAHTLLGLFPVNALHNAIHILFGIWGLAAARSWGGAKSYCQIAGIAYLALALLGFIAPDLFGLMPIGGNDIWLHVLLGVVLAYFGFTAKADAAPVATA